MKLWQFGTISGLLVLIGVAFFQQVQINKLRSTVARVEADAEDAEDVKPLASARGKAKSTWGDKALLLRISTLEKMTTRLTAMVATGGGRRVAANTSGGADATAVASLREDVDAVLTGNAIGTKAGQKKLADLAAKITKKQAEERQQRRDRVENQMIDSRVQAFSVEARIQGQPLENVLAISQDARQKTNQIHEEVQSGTMNYEAGRDAQNRLKNETRKLLAKHLSETQMHAYEKHVIQPGSKDALLR